MRKDAQLLRMSPYFDVNFGFSLSRVFVGLPAQPGGISSSSRANLMNLSIYFSHFLQLHGLQPNINLFISGCKNGAISQK